MRTPKIIHSILKIQNKVKLIKKLWNVIKWPNMMIKCKNLKIMILMMKNALSVKLKTKINLHKYHLFQRNHKFLSTQD